jgi:type IV pilus assembly protein PilP
MRTVFLILLTVAWPAASARAQAAPPAPTTAQTAAPAPMAQAKPAASDPAPDVYTYDPAGRRDPFLNLLGTGSEVRAARSGDGPASMSVSEISVRGVMESRGALIAMIQGPDTKTYVVHRGDKFLDGTIKSITPQGLVVLQAVNDPLSLVKQREVRKLLRSIEGVKD